MLKIVFTESEPVMVGHGVDRTRPPVDTEHWTVVKCCHQLPQIFYVTYWVVVSYLEIKTEIENFTLKQIMLF